MKSIRKKIEKTNVLIRARKAQLSQESSILESIRKNKLGHLQELEQHQKNYMNGVNDLNEERQSGSRSKLSTLERSVDHSKSQWYKSLREVKNLEEQEKAQIEQVLIAQRNLKSLEKIQETQQIDLKKEIELHEQKVLDEHSIHRYSRKA